MAMENKIPKARIIYTKACKRSNKDHSVDCKCDLCSGNPRNSWFDLKVCDGTCGGICLSKYSLISYVYPGSYGEISGFRKGDRIVAVNDVFGNDEKLLEEILRPHVDTDIFGNVRVFVILLINFYIC